MLTSHLLFWIKNILKWEQSWLHPETWILFKQMQHDNPIMKNIKKGIQLSRTKWRKKYNLAELDKLQNDYSIIKEINKEKLVQIDHIDFVVPYKFGDVVVKGSI